MNRKTAAVLGLVLIFSAGCGTAEQTGTSDAIRLVGSPASTTASTTAAEPTSAAPSSTAPDAEALAAAQAQAAAAAKAKALAAAKAKAKAVAAAKAKAAAVATAKAKAAAKAKALAAAKAKAAAPVYLAPQSSSVYYKNCTAVRAAGAAPIHRGEPGYARHLDRDGDGVACE